MVVAEENDGNRGVANSFVRDVVLTLGHARPRIPGHGKFPAGIIVLNKREASRNRGA